MANLTAQLTQAIESTMLLWLEMTIALTATFLATKLVSTAAHPQSTEQRNG